MQTVSTLLNRRVLRRLILVYTICQCPFYGTLDINGLTSHSFTRMIIVTIQCVVLGFADTDFVQGLSDAPHKSFDVDVTRMLDDLIDNKFVKFAGWIFLQTSAFLFELIVLHCLPTCFYTRLRQSLYRVS